MAVEAGADHLSPGTRAVRAGADGELFGADQHGDRAGCRGQAIADGEHPERGVRAAVPAEAVDEVGVADEAGEPGVGRMVVEILRGGALGDRAVADAPPRDRRVDSASSWSWVTSIAVVAASRRIARTSARTLARRLASSEANGSSSSTTRGSTASARASATRCCWPPES